MLAPQTERTVHMHPRIGSTCGFDKRHEGIELAGIHFAGLKEKYGSPIQVGQSLRVDPTMTIGWCEDQARGSKSEQPKRLSHRDVTVSEDDNLDFRCADQAVSIEIPSQARKQRPPRPPTGRLKLNAVALVPKPTALSRGRSEYRGASERRPSRSSPRTGELS